MPLLRALDVCSQRLAADGVGLSLVATPAGAAEPVLATDPVAEELEELQFTIGDAPCQSAARTGDPVLVDDLSACGAWCRWPVLAREMLQRGASGVFAFPVTVGSVTIGALNAYRRRPGSLSRGQLGDADTCVRSISALALGPAGPSEYLDRVLDGPFHTRVACVHQAAGILSARYGLTAADALAQMRLQAVNDERRLIDVADEIIG